MTTSLTITAPAKLNLYLGVYPTLDKRGYHRVDSIMVATSLKDVIDIEPSDKLSVRCIPEVDFPEKTNSCYKAAIAMQEAFCRDAHYQITIHKNIPFKSGLGGASADAASIIVALCRLWDIDIKDKKVLEVAQSLGADVAFFLFATPMLLEGAGDVPAMYFDEIKDMYAVLVRPFGDGITAQMAYKQFDIELPEAEDRNIIIEALQKGDNLAIANNISNNLDPVAQSLMPNLSEVLKWMDEQDETIKSMITGSGSCMYSICPTEKQAQDVAKRACEMGWWAKCVKIISEPPCPIIK